MAKRRVISRNQALTARGKLEKDWGNHPGIVRISIANQHIFHYIKVVLVGERPLGLPRQVDGVEVKVISRSETVDTKGKI